MWYHKPSCDCKRSAPITRLRVLAESGVVKAFLRTVPEAVQDNTAGKPNPRFRKISKTLPKKPEPNRVPKLVISTPK